MLTPKVFVDGNPNRAMPLRFFPVPRFFNHANTPATVVSLITQGLYRINA
jgi:hypothetical protein